MKCACNHNSGNVGRWASLGWAALTTAQAVRQSGTLAHCSVLPHLVLGWQCQRKNTRSWPLASMCTHPHPRTLPHTKLQRTLKSLLSPEANSGQGTETLNPVCHLSDSNKSVSEHFHQHESCPTRGREKKKKEMNLRSRDMKWGEKDPVLSPALCSCNTTAQWTLCGGKWVHQVGIRSSGKSSMAQCCPFSYPFMAFHFLPGDDVIRRAHRITGTCPVAFPPWELSTAFCGSSSRGLRQSKDGVW